MEASKVVYCPIMFVTFFLTNDVQIFGTVPYKYYFIAYLLGFKLNKDSNKTYYRQSPFNFDCTCVTPKFHVIYHIDISFQKTLKKSLILSKRRSRLLSHQMTQQQMTL